MPLASEGSKIMAAILDWWYTPENERLQPKNKHHPIEKKRKPWKTMEKKKPNKSPRKYHLPSTSFVWVPEVSTGLPPPPPVPPPPLPPLVLTWSKFDVKNSCGPRRNLQILAMEMGILYLQFSTNCGHFSQKWQNVGEIIDSNTII